MTYPTRIGARPPPNIKAQDERLQSSLGDRGKAEAGLKMLTRGDMGGLGKIACKSAFVTAAPTAAEHNALVEDIKAVMALLNTMGANFTGL